MVCAYTPNAPREWDREIGIWKFKEISTLTVDWLNRLQLNFIHFLLSCCWCHFRSFLLILTVSFCDLIHNWNSEVYQKYCKPKIFAPKYSTYHDTNKNNKRNIFRSLLYKWMPLCVCKWTNECVRASSTIHSFIHNHFSRPLSIGRHSRFHFSI